MTKKYIVIPVAILLTFISLQIVWQIQKHQDQVIIEQNLQPPDFAKEHGLPPEVAISNMVLGPFRNILISSLWLRMERLQKEGKFFEMVQLADWILRVQPENATIAQYLAWNMAYNITVTQENFDVRRRWIKRAVETLSTALKYNPNDPILYREMTWIYQHKLGDEGDTAGPYYREKMAEENFRIFGKVHSPDWNALVTAPADWQALFAEDPYLKNLCSGREDDLERTFFNTGDLPQNLSVDTAKRDKLINFIRARVIRNELLLEPEHARWVEAKYGELNWLLPEAHAIYWSSLGIRKMPGTKSHSCQQLLSQSLKIMMFSGRIIYADGAPGQNFIRLPNFKIVDATCEEIKRTAAATEGGLQFSGYHYFLMDVIDLLYLYGQKDRAKKYFDLLAQEKPHLTEGKTVQSFVMGRIREQMKVIKNIQLQSWVSSFILGSIFAYANDEDNDAQEMLATAEMLYNTYRKQHSSEEEQVRLRMPAFKEFKRNVTKMVMDNYIDLSPTLKAKLELQENNSKPVEK